MAVFTTDVVQALQDVVKHGGRKLMIWAILLVVGCIQYAHAVQPTGITIAVSSAATQTGATTRIWYAASTTPVVLTCGDDGDGVTYLFRKNGVNITSGHGSDGWDAAAYTVTLDKDGAGMYTCTARDASASSIEAGVFADPVILTLKCTKAASDPCEADDKNSKCDGEADDKQFCQCKLGAADKAGVFPGCFKCAKAAYDGCDKAKYQKCKADGSACVCEHGGNDITKCNECKTATDCKGDKKQCHSGKCVACLANNTGCVATSTTPRCEIATGTDPVCKGCDNDKFCVKINKDTPVCDTKKGNCKAKAKTSDAATVTSTACLVIASVVVALMN